jgi:hypothetical protein
MAKTSLIGLTLPATGTLSGQWGDTVNNAISQIVDVAVAGTQTITVDTDIDLAVTEGTYASTGLTANSSQYAVLLCTGARTAVRNINVPKQSKIYVVINDTTGGFAIRVRGGPTSPTTGVTVAAGTRAILAWDSNASVLDFVNVGGGSAAGSNTQIQFNNAGAFGAAAGLTWDGTTLTANNFIDSSLTASKPVFTDASKNLVSTGTLGVDQGGTGLTTTTPYSVVFSGTTATGLFQAAAGPGTATHVLTSNGAGALPTFQAPAASGVSQARATAIAMVFGF